MQCCRIDPDSPLQGWWTLAHPLKLEYEDLVFSSLSRLPSGSWSMSLHNTDPTCQASNRFGNNHSQAIALLFRVLHMQHRRRQMQSLVALPNHHAYERNHVDTRPTRRPTSDSTDTDQPLASFR